MSVNSTVNLLVFFLQLNVRFIYQVQFVRCNLYSYSQFQSTTSFPVLAPVFQLIHDPSQVPQSGVVCVISYSQGGAIPQLLCSKFYSPFPVFLISILAYSIWINPGVFCSSLLGYQIPPFFPFYRLPRVNCSRPRVCVFSYNRTFHPTCTFQVHTWLDSWISLRYAYAFIGPTASFFLLFYI
jgi:hypothetical protein